jgi:hypothetical protein
MNTITQCADLIRETLTGKAIDDLGDSSEYADFIIENADSDRPITNGFLLTEAMEEGYLFDEFLVEKFV